MESADHFMEGSEDKGLRGSTALHGGQHRHLSLVFEVLIPASPGCIRRRHLSPYPLVPATPGCIKLQHRLDFVSETQEVAVQFHLR